MTQKQQRLEAAAPKEEKKSQDGEGAWAHLNRQRWWECKTVQSLWKTVWQFLQKLNIELLYDPAILLTSQN